MNKQYSCIYIVNGAVKDGPYTTTETFFAKTNSLKCLVYLCSNIACENVIESLKLFQCFVQFPHAICMVTTPTQSLSWKELEKELHPFKTGFLWWLKLKGIVQHTRVLNMDNTGGLDDSWEAAAVIFIGAVWQFCNFKILNHTVLTLNKVKADFSGMVYVHGAYLLWTILYPTSDRTFQSLKQLYKTHVKWSSGKKILLIMSFRFRQCDYLLNRVTLRLNIGVIVLLNWCRTYHSSREEPFHPSNHMTKQREALNQTCSVHLSKRNPVCTRWHCPY